MLRTKLPMYTFASMSGKLCAIQKHVTQEGRCLFHAQPCRTGLLKCCSHAPGLSCMHERQPSDSPVRRPIWKLWPCSTSPLLAGQAKAAKPPLPEFPCIIRLSQRATLVKICSVCISYRKNFTVYSVAREGSHLQSIRLVIPVLNIIATIDWLGPGVTKH